MSINPLRPEVSVEQQTEFLRDPCWSMDTVGYGRDRNLVFRQVRPNDLPHPASHSSVEMADSITPPGHPQSENGHVEGITEPSQLHEFLLADPQIIPVTSEVFFHHMEWKCIVAGRHRGVSGEN